MNDSVISATYEDDDSQRLDKALPELFPDLELSRTKAQQLVEKGCVIVNQKKAAKSSLEVNPGDQVQIVSLPDSQVDLQAYEFELDVVFEDDCLLVINKPAGLTVHPGAGNKSETLVNALVFRQTKLSSGEGNPYRPGIVHRLDKDTTGLLVVAKTDSSHRTLAEQFRDRTASRVYKALCAITPRRKGELGSQEEGLVDAAIGRHPSVRTIMSVDGIAAKTARTHWRVQERFNYAVSLHLKLETGRTHQIRVHMDHIGAPVYGDPLYGEFDFLPKSLLEEVKKFGRQALHAGSLSFIHPQTKEQLSFTAEPPEDFAKLIDVFRKYDAEYDSI